MIRIMKYLLSILFIAFFNSNCKAQNDNVTDALFSCLVNHYSNNKIDLITSLDSLENHLILNKILASKDGTGKIQFYETIINTGQIKQTPITGLMETLTEHYPPNDFVNFCIYEVNDFDSLVYKNSIFNQKNVKIERFIHELGGLNIVNVSKSIVANNSESDFEIPYYRAQMLLSYLMISDKDQAYLSAIPDSTSTFSTIRKSDLVIELTNQNELRINDKNIAIENLASHLIKYLDSLNEFSYICFVMNTSTEYDFYLNILEKVETEFKNYRNLKALEEYNREFPRLTKTEQNKVIRQYPFRYIEIIED